MIDIVLTTLLNLWLWDIAVLSQPWMYYCLLIPALLFSMFVMVKWAVLTAPLWLPFVIILQAFVKLKQPD